VQKESSVPAAPTKGSRATAEAIFSLFKLGCSSCSGIIEYRLGELHGITSVNVDYVTDTVVVGYDPNRLTTDDIRAFMKKVSHDAGD
jgi:copper chaperone CopZ